MAIKKPTKEARYYYNQFLTYKGRTLNDCYEKPSSAKTKIYNETWYLVKSLEGKNLTVLSYNTFMFTLGFTAMAIDENGQQIECFVLRKPSGDQIYKIADFEN